MFEYSFFSNFNLGLNLGALPRMGRQAGCTYPILVLYYNFILNIITGVPNKAVEKMIVRFLKIELVKIKDKK